MPQEFRSDASPQAPDTPESQSRDESAVAGAPVVVRRRAGLAALIGAAASAVAIAYLWRASQTMAVLDWGLCVVMAGIAAVYLATLVDSRTPLLVADDLGVRIRLGNEWRGLPWEAVDRVVVHPRRGLFRDGRIALAPRSLGRALDGLDRRGRRHASMNQKMYGAALAVPVGITTRVSTDGERSVVDRIAALSQGRAEVLELTPDHEAPADVTLEADDSAAAVPAGARAVEPAVDRAVDRAVDPAVEAPVDPATATALDAGHSTAYSEPAPGTAPSPADPFQPPADDQDASTAPLRRSILGGIGTIVSRVAKGRRHDVDGDASAVPVEPAALAGTEPDPLGDAELPAVSGFPAGGVAIPLRDTRPALRAEVTRDLPATLGNAALAPSPDEVAARGGLPEARALRRPGSVDLVFEHPRHDSGRVRPISQLGDPVEPLVIDDFVTEPAYDPVIGPELAAARTRLGLSVDELSERTRIRPHVIESIEVDDFAPCGGDFYARGHLRTLARVLGKDAAPLLVTFEERYATAPVNARRVFEAELATGMTGSMRSTIGGPNWGLLIGVVLSLVLVWGVVRLFAGEPAELVQTPAPVLNSSVGVENGAAAPQDPVPVTEPLPIMLTAAFGDTTVVVRNGDGAIAFSGELVLGEKKRLEVPPPVRVRAVDAGAIEVSVHGRDRGVLGELGQPGRRTFR
ncbi:MAG TPA: RodZ domain-containing protein [Marmoricola sp.]|nr:RodZ domain-containing protein [Marmoricola sp.]